MTLVNESYEAELASLTAPTLFLWGENDDEVPVEIANRARTLTSAPSEVVIAEGIGHLLPTQAPALLAARVLRLLEIPT